RKLSSIRTVFTIAPPNCDRCRCIARPSGSSRSVRRCANSSHSRSGAARDRSIEAGPPRTVVRRLRREKVRRRRLLRVKDPSCCTRPDNRTHALRSPANRNLQAVTDTTERRRDYKVPRAICQRRPVLASPYPKFQADQPMTTTPASARRRQKQGTHSISPYNAQKFGGHRLDFFCANLNRRAEQMKGPDSSLGFLRGVLKPGPLTICEMDNRAQAGQSRPLAKRPPAKRDGAHRPLSPANRTLPRLRGGDRANCTAATFYQSAKPGNLFLRRARHGQREDRGRSRPQGRALSSPHTWRSSDRKCERRMVFLWRGRPGVVVEIKRTC